MENSKETVSVADLLKIIASRVSFVGQYKTINATRRKILDVVFEDLLNLSNSEALQDLICVKDCVDKDTASAIDWLSEGRYLDREED